jgi:hypothetical protein
MPSAPTVRLELRESTWRRGAEGLVVVSAVAALVWAQWPFWIRMIALASLIAGVLAAIVRHRARTRIDALEWRTDGGWWIRHAGMPSFHDASLRDARVVGPLIALDFEETGIEPRKRVALTLWPDSAERDGLRRLRIRLARRDAARGNAPPDGLVR